MFFFQIIFQYIFSKEIRSEKLPRYVPFRVNLTYFKPKSDDMNEMTDKVAANLDDLQRNACVIVTS